MFEWQNTECKLQHHPVAPTCPLPNDCRQTNSVLIDRDNSPITDRQIFQLFHDSAIGVSFCPKCKFLQLFFDDTGIAERVVKDGPYNINGHTLPLFPPKGKLPPRLILKLSNVPILTRTTVKKA